MKRYCAAGSYTIEAALLMPMILAVFVLLIYTSFYLHNMVALKCDIYEENLLGTGDITREVTEDKIKEVIYLNGNMQVPIGGVLEQIMKKPIWSWREVQTVYKINPVEFIRKTRKAQELLERVQQ